MKWWRAYKRLPKDMKAYYILCTVVIGSWVVWLMIAAFGRFL